MRRYLIKDGRVVDTKFYRLAEVYDELELTNDEVDRLADLKVDEELILDRGTLIIRRTS